MWDTAPHGLFSPARVVTAGLFRRPLFGVDEGLRQALATLTGAHVVVPPGVRGWLPLLRSAAAAIDGEIECLHLLDPGLAPAARWVARRRGLRLTATLAVGVSPRAPRSIDHLFVHGDDIGAAMGFGPATVLPPAVGVLPQPSPRRLAEISALLRDTRLGRMTVAVPWPEDRETAVWLRDAVAPLLHGDPLVLLLGVPRGRRARLLFGARGYRARFRLDHHPLDADTLAAAARCADAFVVAGATPSVRSASDLLLPLMASGLPVVVGGGVRSEVLEHERSALLAPAVDRMGLASTLNGVLALPAIQRHFLGEEFARYTLTRWGWQQAVPAYGRAFSSLVGRPQIPMELRAAA